MLRLVSAALLFAGTLAAPIGIARASAGDSPDSAEPTAAVAESTGDERDQPVSRASASGSKSVSIVDYDFTPGSITVDSGDTVVWTNNGKVPEGHNVTGDGLDSGLLNSGDTYSHTFGSAGTFSYVCTLHPGMRGTVKVVSRSASGDGNTGSGEGGGSSGSSAGSSGTDGTTTAGTESAAVAAPDAAGTDTSLPSTGSRSLPLVTIGLALLGLGLALRPACGPRGGRRRA